MNSRLEKGDVKRGQAKNDRRMSADAKLSYVEDYEEDPSKKKKKKKKNVGV